MIVLAPTVGSILPASLNPVAIQIALYLVALIIIALNLIAPSFIMLVSAPPAGHVLFYPPATIVQLCSYL